MVETAGSCGMVSFRGNTMFAPTQKPNPIKDLQEVFNNKRIIRQEIRKQKLEEKGNNGQLNTQEALELSAYKIQDAFEDFMEITKPTICYEA